MAKKYNKINESSLNKHKHNSVVSNRPNVSLYTDNYIKVRKNGKGSLAEFILEEYLWRASKDYYLTSSVWRDPESILTPDVINPRIKLIPDVVSISLGNVVYVLRKTSETKAKYLVRNAKKLTGFLESVVGFVKTFSNRVYLVTKIILSRVGNKVWRISDKLTAGINLFNKLNISDLSSSQKHTIFDKLADLMHKLYSKGLCISKIRPSEIVVTDSNVLLMDPRIISVGNMNCSKKSKTGFEKSILDILDFLFGTQEQLSPDLGFNYHIKSDVIQR